MTLTQEKPLYSKEKKVWPDGVAFHSLSKLSVLELKGKDTLSFLHRISTNSTKGLPPKEGIVTLFTNEKGRLIDQTFILNLEEKQVLVCSQGHRDKLCQWINRFIILDDVEIKENTSEYEIIEVVGEKAQAFLEQGREELLPRKMYPFFASSCFCIKWPHQNLEDRFWIFGTKLQGERAWEEIMQKISHPVILSEAEYEHFRLEKGFPQAPQEIHEGINPHELGLIEFVDFEKGCYIGQEVIARLEAYDKVQKHLFQIVINEDEVEQTVLNDKEQEVGVITSLSSVKEKKQIGLAYLKKKFLSPNINLYIRTKSGSLALLEVRSLPSTHRDNHVKR